jgi:hypothetical protein
MSEKRLVTQLKAKESIHVVGWGELGIVLPNTGKSFKGLEMTREIDGVEVSADGKVSFLIPWTNIKVVQLA